MPTRLVLLLFSKCNPGFKGFIDATPNKSASCVARKSSDM